MAAAGVQFLSIYIYLSEKPWQLILKRSIFVHTDSSSDMQNKCAEIQQQMCLCYTLQHLAAGLWLIFLIFSKHGFSYTD